MFHATGGHLYTIYSTISTILEPSYFNQGETWYTSNTFFQRLVNGSCKLINLTKGEAYMVHYHLFFPERLGEGRFLGAVSLSSMTRLA